LGLIGGVGAVGAIGSTEDGGLAMSGLEHANVAAPTRTPMEKAVRWRRGRVFMGDESEGRGIRRN
jgi:hypothetical protein